MLVLVQNASKATPGNLLERWIPQLQQVMTYPYAEHPAQSAALLGQAFMNDWRTASGQQWFQDAQKAERDRVYWQPAYDQAAADGVGLLGLVTLYDISVNHGPGSDPESFGGIVSAAAAVSPPPSNGGTEVGYVGALIDKREQVLIGWGDNQPDGRVQALRHLASAHPDMEYPISWDMYGTTYTIPAAHVPR